MTAVEYKRTSYDTEIHFWKTTFTNINVPNSNWHHKAENDELIWDMIKHIAPLDPHIPLSPKIPVEYCWKLNLEPPFRFEPNDLYVYIYIYSCLIYSIVIMIYYDLFRIVFLLGLGHVA